MPLFLSSNLCLCEDNLAKLVDPKQYTIAVIANASDMYTDPVWVDDDLKSLNRLGFNIENIDLRKKQDVNKLLKDSKYNGLFVAGGNTFYLLDILKSTGVFEFIKTNINNLLYLGSSAGSVVCSPNIEIIKHIDKPLESTSHDLDGFGFIKPMFLPHFANEYFRQKYDKMFQDKTFFSLPIITVRDSDALWVENGKMEFLSV